MKVGQYNNEMITAYNGERLWVGEVETGENGLGVKFDGGSAGELSQQSDEDADPDLQTELFVEQDTHQGPFGVLIFLVEVLCEVMGQALFLLLFFAEVV